MKILTYKHRVAWAIWQDEKCSFLSLFLFDIFFIFAFNANMPKAITHTTVEMPQIGQPFLRPRCHGSPLPFPRRSGRESRGREEERPWERSCRPCLKGIWKKEKNEEYFTETMNMTTLLEPCLAVFDCYAWNDTFFPVFPATPTSSNIWNFCQNALKIWLPAT